MTTSATRLGWSTNLREVFLILSIRCDSRRAAIGSAWTDSASIVIFGGIIVMRKRKKGKRFFPTEVLLFKS